MASTTLVELVELTPEGAAVLLSQHAPIGARLHISVPVGAPHRQDRELALTLVIRTCRRAGGDFRAAGWFVDVSAADRALLAYHCAVAALSEPIPHP